MPNVSERIVPPWGIRLSVMGRPHFFRTSSRGGPGEAISANSEANLTLDRPIVRRREPMPGTVPRQAHQDVAPDWRYGAGEEPIVQTRTFATGERHSGLLGERPANEQRGLSNEGALRNSA